MDITAAQKELGRAYFRGGPGTIVSAVVWLITGIVATRTNLATGFAVLFFAGMLIFPLSTAIVRNALRCEPISPGNPNGLTVVETIFPMIAGFLAGWLLLPYRPDLAFSMAAIALGAHYFGFRTACGDWAFWVLGGLLCLVGMATIFTGFPRPNAVPYSVFGVEFILGCWLLREGIRDRRMQKGENPA